MKTDISFAQTLIIVNKKLIIYTLLTRYAFNTLNLNNII
jgi:hypothetical protein